MVTLRTPTPCHQGWTRQTQTSADAWRAQVGGGTHSSALQTELVHHEAVLRPRFSQHYEQLRALPRRVRRALRRKLAVSLVGAALLLALGVDPARAAYIDVAGGCTLVDAIKAANTDVVAGSCPAGSGADIINLNSTVSLTSSYNGTIGLPTISTDITIAGNGNTIERAGGSPNFRLFIVSGSGSLTLNDTTVTGGNVVGQNGGGIVNYGNTTLFHSTISANTARQGGGIYTDLGTLHLFNSTIAGNSTTDDGGGLYVDDGHVIILDSTISGNTSDDYGGGMYVDKGTVTIRNSAITGNTSSGDGGGFVLIGSGIVTLTNSTVSGNTASGSNSDGGGFYAEGGTSTLINSTLSGNSAADMGGGLYTDGGTVIVTNSTVSGNSAHDGGGIATGGSPVTVTDSAVSDNTASVFGGGVVHDGSTTTTIINTTISGNSSNAGGGVYGDGGTLTIMNSTISGNSATTLGGGAYIKGSGTATMSNSTISGNTASVRGGGIYNHGNTVTVSNSIVISNTASEGGGVNNTAGGTATILNSAISGNIADGAAASQGGGVHNQSSSVLTIDASTISGNQAVASMGEGGGLFNTDFATAIITNSTISRNESSQGGGIKMEQSTIELHHSTITGNSVDQYGGAIYHGFSSNLLLRHSILSGNTADTSGPTIYQGLGGGATFTAADFNIFGQSGNNGLVNVSPSGSDIVPPGSLGTILNSNLTNNGGLTETHALISGSPAIEPSGLLDCPTPNTDQRGVARPIGPRCDVGAFEFVSLPNGVPIADAGSDQIVNAGNTLALDGTGSFDPNGDALTYSWDITAGMTGLPPNKARQGSVHTLIAPAVDAPLIFTLTVTDAKGATHTDTVTVTVQGQSPVANAGLPQSVGQGQTVILDGTGSTDADGDQLTYVWKQTGGSPVTLSSKTNASPAFTAPNSPTTLTFLVEITDGRRGTSSATVTIMVT